MDLNGLNVECQLVITRLEEFWLGKELKKLVPKEVAGLRQNTELKCKSTHNVDWTLPSQTTATGR